MEKFCKGVKFEKKRPNQNLFDRQELVEEVFKLILFQDLTRINQLIWENNHTSLKYTKFQQQTQTTSLNRRQYH